MTLLYVMDGDDLADAQPRKGPAKMTLPQRKELLKWLIDTPGLATDGTLLDDARKRFHEIMNTNSSVAAVEWLFNQLIGTPRTTIIYTIRDQEVVRAVARSVARYLRPEEFEAWWIDLKAELGGDPSDWTEPTT